MISPWSRSAPGTCRARFWHRSWARAGAVTAQDWAKRILIDFRRVAYLSSTGFAAIFKLVTRARDEGREVKLFGMEPGIRLGAEIVGLDKTVEILPDEAAALRAFGYH